MSSEGTLDLHRIWKRFAPDRRRMSVRDVGRRIFPGRSGRGWNWALRDVSLHAEPGEAVGVLGNNGSGKSTLLQILSGVMHPNAGRVSVSGRIGALLEVRAGIHPELTGGENIFLYGAMLGLPRSVIAKRFDEIVAFAELEMALDRQVKFYSSGMKTRLGFAVAAFLEPEVLVIDEVLAVGDAAFQQKCLDRMAQVIDAGTTLVYVSHDLPTVEATCTRALWLDGGVTRAEGEVSDVVATYRSSTTTGAPGYEGDVAVEVVAVSAAQTSAPLVLDVRIESRAEGPATAFIGIAASGPSPILATRRDFDLEPGGTTLRCAFDRLPLAHGRYGVWFALRVRDRGRIVPWHRSVDIDVVGPAANDTPRGVRRLAPVHLDATWSVSPTPAPVPDGLWRASDR